MGLDCVDHHGGAKVARFLARTNDPGAAVVDVLLAAIPVGVDARPAAVSDAVLQHNYPNPFTDRTRIGFTLPRSCRVSLTVSDILGKRVATLIEADLSEGDHLATFDAARNPDGLYVCILRAGATVRTRMMLLRKGM